MENGIYVGLSHQVALQRQMTIIANNVANMSTPGYRAQNMVFQEFLADKTAKRTEEKEKLAMVLDYGQYQNTQAGPMRVTSNPLDMAIHGKGYFGVQTVDGIMYTRAGHFQLNVDNELTTSDGYLVADEGGGTIVIPPGSRSINVGADGTIITDQGPVGRLMVTEFEDEQTLESLENGLTKATVPGVAATDSIVRQGMVEGSNVQSVIEMTRMIDVLRTYQSTQRMLQADHDLQRTLIQRITRTG